MSVVFIGRSQDSFTLFNKNKEPHTVKELTESLIANQSNDSLKVVAVYKWITENIAYDHAVFMSGEPIRHQSSDLVFHRKKTTCSGYANLMVSMLEFAGIEAFSVEGFTQDYVLGLELTKLSSDHAWVAFKLNGRWEQADPTWDAGDIGILKNVQKESIKKTFWQQVKSFKLKYLFNKKKRQKNKTSTREKVSYKIGFNRNPSMQYLFSDPNYFLKTHLPNVAHVQMKSAPIKVEQFCDSSHALGNFHYTKTGEFNYNQLNDAYFHLEDPERMLWLSDSSLNYHYLNHGDKALNAHNYLAHYYGNKSSNRAFIEKYISLTDTVLLHGNLAIKINKQEYKKKKLLFNEAFQTEKKQGFLQQNQVNYIQKHIVSNADIYRKGRDRINQKEIVSIKKWQNRIIDKYGFNASVLKKEWDTIPQIVSILQIVHAMRDSIIYYQDLEKKCGPNYIDKLSEGFISARSCMLNDARMMYKGKFLNERRFLKKDKEVIDTLTLLTAFLRDSVNTYLGTRRSYSMILKLDQQLKAQETLCMSLQKKDSIFPLNECYTYCNFILIDLLKNEKEVIDLRLSNSILIENAIKNKFKGQSKELGLDMKDLTYIKSMRQAYLTKMMNNKYNRSIKVYVIVINNAKKWKSQYLTKLKRLEE